MTYKTGVFFKSVFFLLFLLAKHDGIYIAVIGLTMFLFGGMRTLGLWTRKAVE